MSVFDKFEKFCKELNGDFERDENEASCKLSEYITTKFEFIRLTGGKNKINIESSVAEEENEFEAKTYEFSFTTKDDVFASFSRYPKIYGIYVDLNARGKKLSEFTIYSEFKEIELKKDIFGFDLKIR